VLILRSLLGAYLVLVVNSAPSSLPPSLLTPPTPTRRNRIPRRHNGPPASYSAPSRVRTTPACTQSSRQPVPHAHSRLLPPPPWPHPRSTPRIDTTATKISLEDWVSRDEEGWGWSRMGEAEFREGPSRTVNRRTLSPPPRHSIHPNSPQTTHPFCSTAPRSALPD
jgi:hypothetical protein